MTIQKEVRRRARHLMSLSSGFQAVAFLGWLGTAAIGSSPEVSELLFFSPMWRQWIELANPSFLAILIAKFPEWVGTFWVLFRLRRLAGVLYTQPPISIEVAESFSRLAGAVTLLVMLVAFGGPVAGDLAMGDDQSGPVIPLGISGFLMFAIVILILRTISALIRQACRIDEENRSFI